MEATHSVAPEPARTQLYVSAFVDLLGFSAALLKLGNQGRDADEAARIAGLVVAFRSHFSDFFDSLARSHFPSPPPAGLLEEDQDLWQRRVPGAPIIQSFTDAVLVSVEVDAARPLATAFAVHALVGACAVTSLLLLMSKDVAVRGGVSFGHGVKLPSGEVVGASLVRAYKLECEEASHPRIVIDPGLFEVVAANGVGHVGVNERELELARMMLEKTRLYLATDADGYDFVDFLGPVVQMSVRHLSGAVSELVEAAIQRGISQIAGADSASRKARSKWRWLAAYAAQNKPPIKHIGAMK